MGCEYCESRRTVEGKLYGESTYCDLLISQFGNKPVLMVKNVKKGCPKYVMCGAKEIMSSVMFFINYCPNCGEKLVEGGEHD